MAQFIKVAKTFINLDNVNSIRTDLDGEVSVYYSTAVGDDGEEREEKDCFTGEEAEALEAYLNNNSVNVVRDYQRD